MYALSVLLLPFLACTDPSTPAKDGGSESDSPPPLTPGDTSDSGCAELDPDAPACGDGGFAADTGACPDATEVCDGGGCSLDLAIETVHVEGNVTEDGATPFEGGWVYFRNAETGTTYLADFYSSYELDIPPGTYDVSYSHTVNAGPDDSAIPILRGQAIESDGALPLPVALHHLSGAITYQGGALPDSGDTWDWGLTFTDTATGRVRGTTGRGSRYDVVVTPGVYDVALTVPSAFAGCASSFLVAEALDVSGSAVLDLSVLVPRVSGSVTWNGDAPASLVVRFEDTTTGDTYCFDGSDGVYAAAVPVGTYDVTVDPRVLDGGPVRVARDVTVVGDATLDLTADTVDVAGALTWNGNPIEEPAYVYLTDTTTGDRLGFTASTGAWSGNVPVGEYDVTVLALGNEDEGLASSSLPLGVHPIEGAGTLDLDASVLTVSGTVTYDGQPVPNVCEGSDEEPFRVLFVSADGDRYWYDGRDGAYEALVPPGTYDVTLYLTDQGQDGVCYDGIRVASQTVIATDTTLDLAACIQRITGTVTWNGAVPDASTYAYVTYAEVATGTLYGAVAEGGTYTIAVPPGTYDAVVSASGTGGPVPATGCVDVR